jgi:hypothetical protein
MVAMQNLWAICVASATAPPDFASFAHIVIGRPDSASFLS